MIIYWLYMIYIFISAYMHPIIQYFQAYIASCYSKFLSIQWMHLTMQPERLISLSINNLLRILIHNDFTSFPDYARPFCYKCIYYRLLLTLLLRRDTITILGPLLTFPINTPSLLSMKQNYSWLSDSLRNENQVRIIIKMIYRAV